MRINLQEILQPPELRGADKQRYWIAIFSWFALLIGVIIILASVLIVIVIWVENTYGEEYLGAHGWALSALFACAILSVLIGDHLWGRLFVKSGYLSRAALIRISTNRFPTKKSERNQRRASVALSILAPALLGLAGWYWQSYWVMGGAVVFLIWLYVSIRNAWLKAATNH